MSLNQNIRVVPILALALTSLAPAAAAEQPVKIDFSDEIVGSDPKSLVAVVGIWRIENEAGKNVLAVDGR